ncbi:MAG: rRNA maturation RNase YbeY [bacterium]
MLDFPEINLSVQNQTKGKLPSLSFDIYKSAVLGSKYELSVNFVSEAQIHKLNNVYRGFDKPTDILSFPLDKNSGEIFICLKKLAEKAPLFERSKENYLAYLYIHGLVHLKGYDHGEEMEKLETKFRKKFNI